MSGLRNSPRYFHVLNDVSIAFADKKIRNSNHGAIAVSETKGHLEDGLIDNRQGGVNRLQRALAPFFKRAMAKVRHIAESSKARLFVLLAKATDHFLKGTGLGGLHAVTMQVGTQVAFGWPISTVKIATRK